MGDPLLCKLESSSKISNLTIGKTYYLRSFIRTSLTEFSVNFDLCINTPGSAPLNDECINAISVLVNEDIYCTIKTTGSTINSLESIEPNNCITDLPSYDVWYSFVATNTSHQIKLSNVSSSYEYAVYSGSCSNLTQLFCSSGLVTNNNGFVVGETYFIRVYATSYADESTFNLCVGLVTPINDDPIGAIQVPVNSNY